MEINLRAPRNNRQTIHHNTKKYRSFLVCIPTDGTNTTKILSLDSIPAVKIKLRSKTISKMVYGGQPNYVAPKILRNISANAIAMESFLAAINIPAQTSMDAIQKYMLLSVPNGCEYHSCKRCKQTYLHMPHEGM